MTLERLTLWDVADTAPTPAVASHRRTAAAIEPKATPRPEPMADRYERITREMLRAYGVRVRKWRSSMSGVAWQVTYRDGTVSRLIEAPRPRGPMSAAIFLHEIGHHAIGFHTYKPRCLEEYHAWRFALEAMRTNGLNVTPAVERRMADALGYAVAKARRRGLKRIPAELAPFAGAAGISPVAT